jgi:uncharacterized protein YjiS (DUF1127 family)
LAPLGGAAVTTRIMPAIALPAGGIRSHDHPVTAAIQSDWVAFRSMLARTAARRRLARSITQLDDRLLADAGLTGAQRGFGDRLVRHFAAASAIWSSTNARVG